jgi:hypothetical protein
MPPNYNISSGVAPSKAAVMVDTMRARTPSPNPDVALAQVSEAMHSPSSRKRSRSPTGDTSDERNQATHAPYYTAGASQNAEPAPSLRIISFAGRIAILLPCWEFTTDLMLIC